MILKTWGGIWGANDFKNMGQNMGRQYKEVFNHFFGFSSKRRLHNLKWTIIKILLN